MNPLPPYLQPRKPLTFYELLEECVIASLTHDQPRKVVKRLFEEAAEGADFHKPHDPHRHR